MSHPLASFSHQKITGWFWVGRHLKEHPIPAPCHRQGHFPRDQVAPSPVQSALEFFQRWGIQNWIYFCCQTGTPLGSAAVSCWDCKWTLTGSFHFSPKCGHLNCTFKNPSGYRNSPHDLLLQAQVRMCMQFYCQNMRLAEVSHTWVDLSFAL